MSFNWSKISQATSFTCAEQIWQHFAVKHVEDQSTVVPCEICGKKFPSSELVAQHFKLSHEPKVSQSFKISFSNITVPSV